MKKQIIVLINILVFLSIICSQFAIAADTSVNDLNSAKAESQKVFDWKMDKDHLSGDYNSIVYGKGLFIAVGNKGIISISKDLEKWDTVFLKDYYFGPDPEGGFNTVLFNGDVFVAAGGRAIAYSKDGYHWNRVDIDNYSNGKQTGFNISYDAIIEHGFSKGRTLILTGMGVLAYSTDGLHWVNQPDVSISHEGMFTIGSIFTNTIYDGSKFVTFCNELIDENYNKKYSVYTSKDGLVWERKETKGFDSKNIECLSFIGGKYYATYYNYYEGTKGSFETKDLADWKESKDKWDKISNVSIEGVNYKLGDGIYSNQKDEGFVQEYKADGTSVLKGLCKGDGKLVAVGSEGLILVKDIDQKGKWMPPGSKVFKSIYSAAVSKTCIVAVGKEGHIIKSEDGHKWSVIKTSIKQSFHSVIYDGNNFVAVGDQGTIAISSNGEAWTLLTAKSHSNLMAVKKLNNKYIAVGSNSTILLSSDAKNWRIVYGAEINPYTGDRIITGVTYSDGMYYAISSMNFDVFSSKDGIAWKQQHGGFREFNDLTFYKGRIVLIGGEWGVTRDMKNFTVSRNDIHSPVHDNEPYRINVFKDFLLTGTADGKIYYSPDGIQWEIADDMQVPDCVNTFVEFKGVYYGFTTYGSVISGVKKGKVKPASDITASYLYNYPDTVGHTSREVKLLNQPIIKNNTVMMTPEAISKIFGGNYNWDKNKKTVQINMGMRTIKLTLNSSKAVANGNKVNLKEKTIKSGNLVYVSAKEAFNSLGYLFTYDSFYRRIYVTIDETTKGKSLSFEPAVFKNNDGNLYFNSIICNSIVYAAVADGSIFTSKDGRNWSRSSDIKDAWFSTILWNGKRFIAAGECITNKKALVYVSDDGVKWSKVDNVPNVKYLTGGTVGACGRTLDQAYTGNDLKQIVMITDDGILTSKDGLEWVKSSEYKGGSICWNKGIYYVSGKNGKLYNSKDGLNWSQMNCKIIINKLISAGDSLWVVQTYGEVNTDSSKLYRSKDGEVWSFVADIPKKIVSEIIYTNKRYILMGNKSEIYSNKDSFGASMVSEDGNIWNYSEAKNLDLTNNALCLDNMVILATSKGLLILDK